LGCLILISTVSTVSQNNQHIDKLAVCFHASHVTSTATPLSAVFI
jgi:hypothetical protein